MLQLYWGFLGGLIWNSSRLFGNRLLCKKTSSQWKKNCGARVFGVEDESWYHGISSKMFVGPNGIPQETGILGWSSLPRCQPSLPMTRKITYLASTAKNMIALETCRFEYFMSFPLRWQGFRGNDQFQQMKIRQWHSAECWHTRHMQDPSFARQAWVKPRAERENRWWYHQIPYFGGDQTMQMNLWEILRVPFPPFFVGRVLGVVSCNDPNVLVVCGVWCGVSEGKNGVRTKRHLTVMETLKLTANSPEIRPKPQKERKRS